MSTPLDRLPLRVKLVAALLGLVTLGLLVSGAAATTALRGYLLGRVDEQLRVAAPAIVDRVERSVPINRPGQFQLPSDFFVRASATDGTTLDQAQVRIGADAPPPPPAQIPAAELLRRTGEPFTVPAQTGPGRWRVVTLPVRDGSAIITVGVPLDAVKQTIRRLVLLELAVGLAVLALLGVIAYAVVRSSLRPLEQVETTAAAIAAGDLSRRVPEPHPGTEVGRLARALNGMLTQIESAFRDRARSESAARASEERLRRFVADAGHELRTPLTSIRGFAELYRQGAAPDPTDVARVMRRIEDEAARMGLLVDDLLLLARLDQQRPLERRPVDLLVLAADAVTDARAVDPGRPVELQVVGSAAPVVTGDEPRLRQVVANLVANALRHTPPGTRVVVTVGVEGASAMLAVTDHGPGLAPEEAERVFERFYRADPSRTRARGGTGLGLSIVAALVAAHGGTVDVETSPGHGATFRVRLPLAEAPHERLAAT